MRIAITLTQTTKGYMPTKNKENTAERIARLPRSSTLPLEIYRGLTMTVGELDEKTSLNENEIQNTRNGLFALMLMLRTTCPKQHQAEMDAIDGICAETNEVISPTDNEIEFAENFCEAVNALSDLLQIFWNSEEFSDKDRAEALGIKRRLDDLLEIVESATFGDE